MNLKHKKFKEGYYMVAYFAYRIEKGRVKYNTVIKRYPHVKEELDLILASDGYTILKDGTVIKSEVDS